MPFLHRKPFIRKRPPTNIKPNDKVFYCELSNEIFINYDEFWERLVLLNALVWSCELTGRPNLTFKEALDSETKAKKYISNVPKPLKVPILYTATLTRRAKLADMSEDIFCFIRDRYFLHEEVEAIVGKHWYDCKVTDIILPTMEELTTYNTEMAESDDESIKSIQFERDPLALNGVDEDEEDDDDIIILRDDHQNKKIEQVLVDMEKKNKLKKECEAYPPYPTIRYQVEELEPWDLSQCKRHIVIWEQIRRTKGCFTKEKCKLFLKNSVYLNSNGYLTIKDSLIKKYRIDTMVYTDMFVGIPPKFASSKPKNSGKALPSPERKKETPEKKIKKKGILSEIDKKNQKIPEKKVHKSPDKKNSRTPEKKSPKDPLAINGVTKDIPKKENVKTEQQKLEEKERMKEQLRLKMELLRAERKRKKDLEREEKWLMTLCMAEWNSVREDLKCGNHKDLPVPKPVQCRIPDENFGDFLMVLEFVSAFNELLELKDVYPQGISFDMLEHAVVEKEVAGIFNDILQLFLGAIFSLQEEEEEEIQADNSVDTGNLDLENHLESKDLKAAVSVANKASTYCQQHLSIPLQKAPLDALTLTEVLRLHLLSSGATNVTNAYWRMLNRGGFRSTDDPGLQFKVDEPKLLKELAVSSVFEMAIGDKMKILSVLLSQILTYASVRDSTDDKVDKLRELHNTLRLHKFAENRKDREEKSRRNQRLKEEKQKTNAKKVEPSAASNPTPTEGDTNVKPSQEANGLENGEEPMNEEEKLAQEERETKNREKRKQESQKKEKSLIEQIAKLNKGVCQLPLGQDRAHRRFWLSSSVPAFFVEDGYGYLGTCSENPTPARETPPSENELLKTQVAAYASKSLELKEKEKSHSDKENMGEDKTQKLYSATQTKKLLKETDDNISVGVKNDSNKNESRDSPKVSLSPSVITYEFDIDSFLNSIDLSSCSSEQTDMPVFGLCSGDVNSCCVHSNSLNRPKWSFYSDSVDLDTLINSLNDRGVRECELKDNLIFNKDAIEDALRNCPLYKLDPSQEPDLSLIQRKSHRGGQQSSSPNLNFPPNTPVHKILETTLRDMVLEIEEKIDSGMLGRLKVPERETWRLSISEGASSSSIVSQEIDWAGRKRLLELKTNMGFEINEEEGEPSELHNEITSSEAHVIKDMSIAILMIGQAIDPKYLKAPLADSDKQHRTRQILVNRMRKLMKKDSKADGQDSSSSSDEDEGIDEKTKKFISNSDNVLRTSFEKWEKSLMTSTSFSQLYLHLALLDNSITWSRSALNARCCLCRRKSDPENMLLCDECDRGHHIYCLKPKMKAIPVGDWFCEKCRPKEKAKSPRKNRKIYKEESDEEEDEVGDDSSSDGDQESKVDNMEYCFACELGGELICCDTCPRSFHSNCLEMRKIPRGSWSCPLCRENFAKAQNKRRSQGSSRGTNENYRGEKHEGGKKRTFDKVEEEPYHKPIVENLLNDLATHKSSWPFIKPVYRVDCPDYYTKIKKPMDLRTMKNRMNKEKYSSDTEFIADVLLIFQNCQQYYKENSAECKASLNLSKYFWAKVEKLGLHSNEHEVKQPSKKRKR